MNEADRKTENSSEKPNNCDTCRNWDTVNDHCYFIQKCKYEPQYDFGEYADRLWEIAYERGKREALEQTEPQTEWENDEIKERLKDEPQT